MSTTSVPFSLTVRLLLSTVVLLLGGLFLAPAPAMAIGLSPPEVSVEGLLRGTTQYRKVSLSRSFDEAGDIFLRVEPGAEDADFFLLETKEIVILDGQNSVDYTFGITPGSAPNGEYDLQLRFLKTAAPIQRGDGATVAIVTGVTAKVFVSVGGEERKSYELSAIQARETEEGLDVPVTFIVSNTGNIDWRASRIVFDFFNPELTMVAQAEISGEDIPIVKAGQEGQRFDVYVPVDLPRGLYTIEAFFYDEETLVKRLSTINPFVLHPPGTLEQFGEMLRLGVSKDTFLTNEKIKVNATFQNTGKIDVDAVLTLDLTRDDETVDFVRSKEYKVSPGREFVFTEVLSALPIGSYTLNGLVEYGSRRTESRQTTFEVREPESAFAQGGKRLNSFAGIVGLSVAVIAIAVVIVAVRRRRRHKDGSPPTPPVPPTPPTPPAPATPPPIVPDSSPSSSSLPSQTVSPVQDQTPGSTSTDLNYPQH